MDGGPGRGGQGPNGERRLNVPPEHLYRANAWRAYRRGTELGVPLELSFESGHFVYHAVVTALLAGLAFVLCVPMNDNASGRGFVRLVGARAVTTIADGPVERLLATPGTHVVAGQPIVEQYRADQSAEVDRLGKEFDGLWVRLLRDPLDEDARRALTVTVPALRRARALLLERTLRAPIDGVLTDVRVSEGRHVVKGDTVFVVAPENAAVEVIAVLPAAARPQLSTRAPARFWVDGADSNTSVALTDVHSDAMGPAEVARLLGPSVQGSVVVEGMSVVVTGSLPERRFQADGKDRWFYEGMLGQLDVTLERKPLLFLVVPTLRRWVYR